MKKYKQIFVWLFLFPVISVFGYYEDIYSSRPVILYGEREEAVEEVAAVFLKYGIDFETPSEINKSDQLHIIVGMESLDVDNLPPYYILYQIDEMGNHFTKEEQSILNHAVAIWDHSWKNIEKYRTQFSHYYFFSPTYEYNDPALLACFLPSDQLSTYKEILASSNSHDSDMSSLLPIIFVHGVLQQPKYLMEIGVGVGQSNAILARLPQRQGFKMIGIDIDKQCGFLYQKYSRASTRFFWMDDTLFLSRRKSFPFIPAKDYDLIFIDTSHLFDHTMKELQIFSPLLSNGGTLLLYASNLSPLEDFSWRTISGKKVGRGWDNDKGVARAIKAYFGIDFDETKYLHKTFMANGSKWKIVHYPFCNGLTLLKKM